MRNLGRTHTLNNLKQRPRNKSSEAQCFYPLIWKWRSEITTPCTTQVLRSTKSKFRNLWEPTRTSRRASFFLWEFWRSWGYIMWGCLKAKYRSIFFKSKLNYYRKWTLFWGGSYDDSGFRCQQRPISRVPNWSEVENDVMMWHSAHVYTTMHSESFELIP